MLIQVRAEALEVMFDKKHLEEPGYAHLDREVPGQCDGEEEGKSRPPEAAQHALALAPQRRIGPDN